MSFIQFQEILRFEKNPFVATKSPTIFDGLTTNSSTTNTKRIVFADMPPANR